MKRPGLMLLVLLGATAFAFSPGLRNGFVSWDDPQFITGNTDIRALTPATIGRMFSSAYDGNYIPLTILSFALNHAAGGLDPLGYHAANLALHLANVALAFLLFRRLGAPAAAAWLAAAFFALHPLRVESVSWATERKDVLFAFFYLLALVAHARPRSETGTASATVLGLYVAALLAKPMAVTLPFALALIDHWRGERNARAMIRGALPFVAIALIFSLVTVFAQSGADAIRRDAITALANRPLLAANSLLFYLRVTVWPRGLTALHPYPESITPDLYYAPIVLVALGVAWAPLARRWPVVGYAMIFFVATLLPVLNVLPAGGQMMADRFTYIPALGPALLAGLGIHRMGSLARPALRWPLIGATAALLLMLAQQSHVRTRVWRNDETLWRDCLRTNPHAYIAWVNLGNFHLAEQRAEDALASFTRAIELWPNVGDAYYNRALALRALDRTDEAILDLDRAAERDPDNANVFLTRAELRARTGLPGPALADYTRALRLQPRWAVLYARRGGLLLELDRVEESLADLETAVRLAPDDGSYQALMERARARRAIQDL